MYAAVLALAAGALAASAATAPPAVALTPPVGFPNQVRKHLTAQSVDDPAMLG